MYSKEAIMIAMLAANIEEEAANQVISILDIAENNTLTAKNSEAYKRYLLSVGSYEQMERKVIEFDEQDIVY